MTLDIYILIGYLHPGWARGMITAYTAAPSAAVAPTQALPPPNSIQSIQSTVYMLHTAIFPVVQPTVPNQPPPQVHSVHSVHSSSYTHMHAPTQQTVLADIHAPFTADVTSTHLAQTVQSAVSSSALPAGMSATIDIWSTSAFTQIQTNRFRHDVMRKFDNRCQMENETIPEYDQALHVLHREAWPPCMA